MTARAAPAIWPYPHRTVAEVDAQNMPKPAAVRPCIHEMPANMAELVNTHSDVQIAKMRGVSRTTVKRWRKALGIKSNPAFHGQAGSPPRPLPEDFRQVQVGKSAKQLAAHYTASTRTVARWIDEAGVRDQRHLPRFATAPRERRPKPVRKTLNSTFTQSAPVDRPHVDGSPAGLAAEFLRQFGPVIRCNERGDYSPKGNRWRRGSFILTADEIIQRAERNGWRGGRLAA